MVCVDLLAPPGIGIFCGTGMSRLPPMAHFMDDQKPADDRNLGYVGAQIDRVGIVMVLGGKVGCGSELLPSSCRKVLMRFNDNYTDPWASCVRRGHKHPLGKRVGSTFAGRGHQCSV